MTSDFELMVERLADGRTREDGFGAAGYYLRTTGAPTWEGSDLVGSRRRIAHSEVQVISNPPEHGPT